MNVLSGIAACAAIGCASDGVPLPMPMPPAAPAVIAGDPNATSRNTIRAVSSFPAVEQEFTTAVMVTLEQLESGAVASRFLVGPSGSTDDEFMGRFNGNNELVVGRGFGYVTDQSGSWVPFSPRVVRSRRAIATTQARPTPGGGPSGAVAAVVLADVRDWIAQDHDYFINLGDNDPGTASVVHVRASTASDDNPGGAVVVVGELQYIKVFGEPGGRAGGIKIEGPFPLNPEGDLPPEKFYRELRAALPRAGFGGF